MYQHEYDCAFFVHLYINVFDFSVLVRYTFGWFFILYAYDFYKTRPHTPEFSLW